ncbi:Alpha/Beta hydrolase protein [Xylariomycetidae sp. FL2044]|nr:Alpha/Beta hydrolase protein [Xylariomycetidae sp. FL2044]
MTPQGLFALFLLGPFIIIAAASPVRGRQRDNRAKDTLPVLDLPYASYRASEYRSESDVYIFKNIRYAAPPTGNLRWAKPAPPMNESGIQDGSLGHICHQAAPNGLNLLGTGNQFPIGGALNQFLGGIPVPLFSGGNEDCLFLDLYVPGKAIGNPSMKLPVVVYIYGGAYAFGSKDSLMPDLPFYDGTGLVAQSSNNMIFVTMNYRVGAYGFLDGTTMEKEGTPNAGLWDQRAAFQWVRDYISLIGGDPTRVTAMGESAGAGSIMYHLVGQGGRLDPLFSKAILLSPAFEYMWDRKGTVQATFETFARLAGCAGRGLACLRAADAAALAAANTQLMRQQYPGTFAVGPTPDGALIRQLPVLELSTGNHWDVESLILSHTTAESELFVSGLVQSDEAFAALLGAIFANYTVAAGITDKIAAFYAQAHQSSSSSSSQTDRVVAFVRDSSFTCNVRHLTEALGTARVWNLQYGVWPGLHGTDLVPTFYNARAASTADWLANIAALLRAGIGGALVAGLATALQSYWASYIVTGDPNTHRRVWFNVPPTIRWDHPYYNYYDDDDNNNKNNNSGQDQHQQQQEQEQRIAGVVALGDWGFSVVEDRFAEKAPCDFWRDVAAAVTGLGGYAAPGAVVAQGLAPVRDADASRNYRGGN